VVARHDRQSEMARGGDDPAVIGIAVQIAWEIGGVDLQAVPIVKQHQITVVRNAVVDDDSQPSATGPIVFLALANWMAREAREAKPPRVLFWYSAARSTATIR
jgi:hypothetical protein